MSVRRVVAGRVGADCTVVRDDEAPVHHDFRSVPGLSDTLVWALDPVAGRPALADLTEQVGDVPARGQVFLKVVRFPPDRVYADPGFDASRAEAELRQARPEFAETFEPGSGGMHRTRTVDLVTVLSGRLRLVMGDATSVDLNTGDVVVQDAGRHRWSNPWSTPATISVVQIGQ